MHAPPSKYFFNNFLQGEGGWGDQHGYRTPVHMFTPLVLSLTLPFLVMLLLQTVVLAVMYVEVITVLIRQQNHFRITRALRPLFFIDNYLMSGVRRYVHVYVYKGTIMIMLLLY